MLAKVCPLSKGRSTIAQSASVPLANARSSMLVSASSRVLRGRTACPTTCHMRSVYSRKLAQAGRRAQSATSAAAGTSTAPWAFSAPLWHTRHVACKAQAAPGDGGNTVQLEIKVDGMVCGGCSSRVQEALAKMQNVKQVEVSLDKKMATVDVEAPTLVDAMNMLPKMVESIQGLGFEAQPHIDH